MRVIAEILFRTVCLAALVFASGCDPFEELSDADATDGMMKPWASSEISAMSKIDNHDAPLATKSMIDQTTTHGMETNFLRIDENQENNVGKYTFGSSSNGGTDWNSAYVLEGTVAASPDNTENIHYRSTYFEPVQTYNINVVEDPLYPEQTDTTQFYHTRMVGWYPKTCSVPRDADNDAVASRFSDKRYSEILVSENGEYAVRFSGLDGETDLMVSDVREGQQWHSMTGNHASDIHPDTGESIYRSPFGHYSQPGGPEYSNFFTFKHYLSAIRIYVYADQSPQNLEMWGNINAVTISNQPTSCVISLPQMPGKNGETGEFGDVLSWGDRKSLPVIQTPMYGDNAHDEDGNLSVEFPLSLIGSSSSGKYAGYAMIEPEPENGVTIGLHTSSGVYYVNIPRMYPEENGVRIFKAGYIYDIHLNLQTGGTIAALLQDDSDKRYYDLTSLQEFSGDAGQSGDGMFQAYRYANCYVIKPGEYKTEDGEDYDGYCFSATVVGNGEAGILSYGAQTLYPVHEKISPVRAQLIWSSELGLVSQVELIYGYVRFSINPDARGNAVIGVFDEQDKVLWSWHIWICDESLDEMTKKITSEGSKPIYVLDRNLGAASENWNDSDPVDTYGLYYQWGRKDPSMGPPSKDYSQKSLVTDTYYDFSLEAKNSAEVKMFAEPTLKDGIENPMYLILPTSQTSVYRFNWLYDNMTFLWGNLDDAGDSEKVVHKTIYDPCPFGYRISGPELVTLFTKAKDSGNISYETYGQILKFSDSGGEQKLYFPYAGYKGVDRGLNSIVGSWRYVGKKGDYQSSWCSPSGHRSRIYISAERSWNEPNVQNYIDHVTHDETNRRTAASVRCVKDEGLGGLLADISVSSSAIVPGVSFRLSWNVTSVASNITDVKIEALVNGQEYSIIAEEYPGSVVHQNSLDYSLTGQDLELLGDNPIIFRITASNAYGLETFSTCSASAAQVEFDAGSWKSSVNNGLYEGDRRTPDFVFYSNLQVLDEIVITDSDGTPISYRNVGNIGLNEDNLYVYNIKLDSRIFNSSVTYGYKVMSSGIELLSGTASVDPKTLTVVKEITDLSELNDDGYYIITTSDRIVSAEGAQNGRTVPITDRTDFQRKDIFRIVKDGSSYYFSNENESLFLNDEAVWTDGDWMNPRKSWTLSRQNGSGFKVYYSGLLGFRSYYWVNDNNNLGYVTNADSGDVFHIYEVSL